MTAEQTSTCSKRKNPILPPHSTVAVGRKALEIQSQRVHVVLNLRKSVGKARMGLSARSEEGWITEEHLLQPSKFYRTEIAMPNLRCQSTDCIFIQRKDLEQKSLET